MELLTSKGVRLVSLKENWIDYYTPQGRMVAQLFGVLNQFERELTAQRTKEKLEELKSKGVQLGRKTRVQKNRDKIELVQKLFNEGKTYKEIMTLTGLGKSSVYNYINQEL